MMMKIVVLGLVGLFSSGAAHAQVNDGVWSLLDADSEANLGQLGVSATAGVERWAWTGSGSSFPADSFFLEPRGSYTGTTTHSFTHTTFPSAYTANLPTSLGSTDRFYRVRVCNLTARTCANMGYMWSEDDGSTLHWYANTNVPASGLITADADEMIRFKALGSVPSTSNKFRYIAEDNDE